LGFWTPYPNLKAASESRSKEERTRTLLDITNIPNKNKHMVSGGPGIVNRKGKILKYF
jgi:hypothetical protein